MSLKFIKGEVYQVLSDNSVVIFTGGMGYSYKASREAVRLCEEALSNNETIIMPAEVAYSQDFNVHYYILACEAERLFFNKVSSIQGISRNNAISLLNLGDVSYVLGLIAQKDEANIKRGNGIGPKTAKRIISEIDADALAREAEITLDNTKSFRNIPPAPKRAIFDAPYASVLQSMGFSASEIKSCESYVDPGVDESEQIKQALKFLSARRRS